MASWSQLGPAVAARRAHAQWRRRHTNSPSTLCSLRIWTAGDQETWKAVGEDAGASAGPLQQRPTSTLKNCGIKRRTSRVKRSVESDHRRWPPCQHTFLGGWVSLRMGNQQSPLSRRGREPEQPGCRAVQVGSDQAPKSAHSRSLAAHQIAAISGLEWPQPHNGR